MELIVRGGVIGIILLGTNFTVVTDDIKNIRWPGVLVIGFLVGSGISLPIQFALDPPGGGGTAQLGYATPTK